MSAHRMYSTPSKTLDNDMGICRTHKRIIAGAASLGLIAALSACRPVTGNLHDLTPPSINFSVNGVAASGSVTLGGVGQQIVITATDTGGVESLETAIENHFICTAGASAVAESDTNPMSLKGYDYSIIEHAYLAHRTAPDDFWPDKNNNGVKDVSEHKLRYDQLIVIDDASLVQQSLDTYHSGADCLLPDGTTHGTVSGDRLLITATAKNTRSEIASAPASQSTRTATLQVD